MRSIAWAGLSYQVIASGLLGRASSDGGAGTAALGLLLQWLMSVAIAAIYGAAGLRLPTLFDKPVRFGALYGFGVFIVFGLIIASTLSLMRVARRAVWI